MSSPAMAAQAKRFDVILKRPENRECFDCTSKQPRWASTNLGIFFCLRCAGIHRSLGVHISKVKSTTMDLWEESMIDCCDHVGNERARSLYEALAPPGHRKPDSTTDTSIVERLLRQKYVDRKYFAKNAEEARDMMIATGLSQQASKSSTGTPSSISTPSAFASGGAAPVAVARVAPAATVPARPAPATNSTVSLFQSDDGWSDFHTSCSSPATAPSPPTTTTVTATTAATATKGTTAPSHFDDFFQAQPQRNAPGPSMDLYFGGSQPTTTSAPHAVKPAAQISVDQLFHQGSSGSTSSHLHHQNHPPHGHGSARNGHHGNDSHDIFGDWTKSTHHAATTSNHHPPRAGPTFSNSSSSFGSVGGAHHHHHHPHHPNTTNHGHSSSSKPHHHSSSSSSSGHMTDAQREMLSMMRPNNGPRVSPAVTASTTSSIDSFF